MTIPRQRGVSRGGTHTIDSSADTCVRSGNGRPAAYHHYINMEYTPLWGVNAAGPALPEALGFLLISRLLPIEFKGLGIKLQNVAHKISVDKPIFMIFFNLLLLSYKPSNFARAIYCPMPRVKGLNIS